MGQRRKLRTLLRLFGDKVSIIRASVSLNRAASHVHLAVLRATSLSTSCSAPSDRRLSAVLRLGHGSSITTSACVAALMTRLHSTNDAIVALKTLITVHALISRSSSSNILDHQLSFSATGAWNPLNLSSFRDDSDAETWELSSCVRWYAEYLEQILITNRALGYLPISPSPASGKVSALLNSDLIREINGLATLLELISNSPASVHLQRNNLIYEVVRLVCEDYGAVRGDTFHRVVELGDRLEGLTSSELTEVLAQLDRVEGCKEKLLKLFGNRKNRDGLWDAVAHMRIKISAMKERMEGWKLVRKKNWNSAGGRAVAVRLVDSAAPLAISTVGSF
ncbi:hypothetical protein SAY86_003282 [Trapa natans]|uniref:ENTH domain-containing protein n=1 Tax=Trapa natans TaxID=22666 RepID=A0AAN7RHS8_TRANT|nr:hypothetical protein SAY86_003282 [Trapa natans]